MSSEPINPHEVFRSQVPVGTSLVVVFVPSKDRDGKPIDQDRWVEMLTEEQIRQSLHAGRVIPFGVASSHGPLGLEQLAAAVARHVAQPGRPTDQPRVRRPIELRAETWEKLDDLADATARTTFAAGFGIANGRRNHRTSRR